MKIAFNPSTVAALTTPPNNKDITFDLRGRNIFARGVKFCGTDTWRDIKINNVSIGSNILDLRNGSNTTLTNTNGVVTINSTWRPVVDNLTSDSTTSSLSAKQGKVLKALIDGKSNSGHTHDDRYLKLTGGTMASNALITFADSGSWGTDKGPQGARGGLYWTGQSDYAKLYAEETAGDNLDLVIQFGDDNSNGLSIRNKANTQTSYISANGVITTKTFKGNLDWSYITNKPSSYTPSAHTHAWNSLTHSSTTENQAILTNGKANGWKLYTLNISRWDNAANNTHSHSNKSVLDGITSALVNNWNTAFTFVNTITGTDTDKIINKWDEIVNFLAGITEDNKLNTLLNSKLSVYELANNTNVGAIKNNGIYYSTTDASSGTLTNSPFNTGFALINMTSYDGGDDLRRSRLAFNAYGEIKVSDDRDLANTVETWYNVLTSKNSGINGSTIKLNGTSITVYSSSTADGRYVKKSGDTMTGTLNFANNIWNNVGDDVAIGDHNVAGCLGIKGLNAGPGLAFYNSSNTLLSKLVGTANLFLRVSGSNTYTIIDTASSYITNGVYVFNRSEIGNSPNYDNPGKNGLFEIRSSSEVTGETGTRPSNGYGAFLNLKTPDNIAMLQIVGFTESLYYRARLAANVTMSGLSWKKVLDTGNSYVRDGKGVINGTTITQVDNAINSTNSTNARKLVNWYSARPTSLNTLFGDGSLRIFYATSSTTEGKPAEDSHILHLAWDNNGGWDTQLAVHTRSGKVSTRAQNSGTWQPWKTLAFTTDIPTSLKNPHALTISLNGTSQGSYDGSAAKNINITPSSIGAATSGHNHDGRYVYNYGGTQMDGASINKNALGMATNSGITGDWWHILQAAWNSEYRWNSLIAFPTLNRNGMYYRSGLDDNTKWGSWVKLLDVNNYSFTLDSRYYTESEVNNLLNAKLNRQNLSYGTWNPRGYNLAADYHYNGGDLSISENGGKMYVSIDGLFYQNEGLYRVLDTSDISGIRGSLTLSQYLSATDAAWYPLVWGGSDHKNTNNSTGSLYKSYDKLSWLTSSLTLYTTHLQTTDITFPNSGTSMRGIQGTVGDNDAWRIKGGATASNSGYLEIATADDGNEPIYVRQYTGTFSTIKRTLTLLDANGYTHFPSYINIGGNENNNSSPDRVWGSNSSDSYLRSYRTSALRVAYAVNANSATTASSANKLTTARNIALGMDLRGSANFDGSGNITINANINACTVQVSSTNGLPFKRIAHFETGSSWNDNSLLLYISLGYINGSNGICRVEFRTDNISSSSTSVTASAAVRWLVRNGYSLDSLYAGYYVTTGKAYIDIYLKTTGSYQGTVIRVLLDSRGGINSNILLINSYYYSDTNHKEAYNSIEAASTALYNRAYTRIVSGSDVGTVSYSNSTGSVHWNNVTNKPSSFTPSSHTHTWTSITDKLVAGNEFNIVNAGFNAGMWFNYVPINDRSKTATITGYHFGNGHQGYASINASGFIKKGSNSNYVLLGDGGHKLESSLNVANADKVDGYHETAFPRLVGIKGNTWNWNDVIRAGYYKIQSGTITNHPSGIYPFGMAEVITTENHNDGENRELQIYYPHSQTNNIAIWLRMHNSSTQGNGWGSWVGVPNTNGNIASATKLQTPRTIWGQSFDGTANVDNTLRIRKTTGNYCEGIRIQTGDNSWATIVLGATADSGTNANAWSIHRKSDNNFAISRNSSDGLNGLVMTSVGMGLGTTSPTQRLDVHGNIRATGNSYAAHFYESSDKTLKKNIKSILSSTNIPKIREFDWKDTGEHSYGFIALELEELGYDCLVSEVNGKKTVNYTATLALTVAKLLNLINIQNKKISNLTKELKALKYGRKKNS